MLANESVGLPSRNFRSATLCVYACHFCTWEGFNGEEVGGEKYSSTIPPLMLMQAGWELASKQGGITLQTYNSYTYL